MQLNATPPVAAAWPGLALGRRPANMELALAALASQPPVDQPGWAGAKQRQVGGGGGGDDATSGRQLMGRQEEGRLLCNSHTRSLAASARSQRSPSPSALCCSSQRERQRGEQTVNSEQQTRLAPPLAPQVAGQARMSQCCCRCCSRWPIEADKPRRDGERASQPASQQARPRQHAKLTKAQSWPAKLARSARSPSCWLVGRQLKTTHTRRRNSDNTTQHTGVTVSCAQFLALSSCPTLVRRLAQLQLPRPAGGVATNRKNQLGRLCSGWVAMSERASERTGLGL